ncbi:MAG: SapC family protein [Alphaproteobacteria bacterium]|nr:SapC family protein [Alphaproteobacteria bacterium]
MASDKKKNGNSEAPKTEAPETDATKPALPLFYSDPHALSVERHGKKAISTETNYSFAKDTNSVPVTAMELTRVMRSYPIVFTASEPVVPVAILGLRGAKNQFVSDDGAWQAGCYIPAYVRRYPFILMESPDKLQYTLCVDESASQLVDEGQPLFDNGEAAEISKKALEFCSAYQGQHAFTIEFTATLEKYSLLVENRAAITMASGEELSLSGFRVIDEKKFMALPDDIFLDWRQRGWIPLVYCHLLSMGNWQNLADNIATVEDAA